MAANPPITFGGELQQPLMMAADPQPHILKYLQSIQPNLDHFREQGHTKFEAYRKMDALFEQRKQSQRGEDLLSDEEPSVRTQATRSSLPRSTRPSGLAKRMRGKDEAVVITPPSTSSKALDKTDSVEKIVKRDQDAETAFLEKVKAKQQKLFPVKAKSKEDAGEPKAARSVLEERARFESAPRTRRQDAMPLHDVDIAEASNKSDVEETSPSERMTRDQVRPIPQKTDNAVEAKSKEKSKGHSGGQTPDVAIRVLRKRSQAPSVEKSPIRADKELKKAPPRSAAQKQSRSSKKRKIGKENEPDQSSEAIVPQSQLLEQRRQRRRAKESILKPDKPAPKSRRRGKLSSQQQSLANDSEREHSELVRPLTSLDNELKRKGRDKPKNVGLKLMVEYEPRVTRGRITLGPVPPGISAKSIGSKRIVMGGDEAAHERSDGIVKSKSKRARPPTSTSSQSATRKKWRKEPKQSLLDVPSSATSWSDSESGRESVVKSVQNAEKELKRQASIPTRNQHISDRRHRDIHWSPIQDTVQQTPGPSKFFQPPERSLAERFLDVCRPFQDVPERGINQCQEEDPYVTNDSMWQQEPVHLADNQHWNHLNLCDASPEHYENAYMKPSTDRLDYSNHFEIDEEYLEDLPTGANFDHEPELSRQEDAPSISAPLDMFGTSFEEARKQIWVGKAMRR